MSNDPIYRTITPCWFVWRKRGDFPKAKHRTFDDAMTEAKRLAMKFPNDKFFVLQVQAAVSAQEPIAVIAVKSMEN